MALYELLLQTSENPVIALNYAVAVAMVRGEAAGLSLLDTLEGDQRIAWDHRLPAVRAHLLERSGDAAGARAAYEQAAERSTNPQQQRYLRTRAARLPS
jgi:predicted RNA polymerase sigma factor